MKFLKYPLYLICGFVIGAALSCTVSRSPSPVAPSPVTQDSIMTKIRPSLVTLRNPDNLDSGGTGFAVIAPSGKIYILTNAHICEMTDKDFVLAKHADSAPSRYARVRPIEITNETDLCLVSAEGTGLQPLKVAATANPVREHVYVVGYPRLNPLTVTEGHYSGTSWIKVQYCQGMARLASDLAILPQEPNKILLPNFGDYDVEVQDTRNCLRSLWATQSTALTYPGNSGSPTLNDAGEVVGVLFAGSSRGESFHVPLAEVQKFLSRY